MWALDIPHCTQIQLRITFLETRPMGGRSFSIGRTYRHEGHAIKLIRALYALEKLDLEPEFPLSKKDFHTAFAAGEGNQRTLKRAHLTGASWAETPDGIKTIIKGGYVSG